MTRKRLPGLLLGAMDGGSLERRVLRLIDTRLPWARRWRVASAAVCLLTLGAASTGIGMLGVRASVAQAAESAAAGPVFTVASIKRSDPDSKIMGYPSSSAASFIAKNMSLESLIGYAYDVPTVQTMTMKGPAPYEPEAQRLTGIPAWAHSDRFDITAKADEATVKAWEKLPPAQKKEQVHGMLRALLAERFHLTMRHETRELPTYYLVVAKNGSKLQPTPPDPPRDPNAPPKPYEGPWRMGPGAIAGHGVTAENLASVLWMARELRGRQVIDKTGLLGKYDFQLKWASEDDPGGDSSGPSLFTAIQEQLGLKLESAQMPTDILVIDHAERPTEN